MKEGKVVWYDAHGGSGEWTDLPGEYEPLEVTTYGLIQQYPEGLVVIPSIAPEQPSSEPQCFGQVHIPMGCVKSVAYNAQLGA